MLSAQSTTKEYIRAKRRLSEEIFSWRHQWGRDKTGRTEGESGEFMEWNTVERAIKTEISTDQNKKEWAKVGLCQKHKPKHPHHVQVSPVGAWSPIRTKRKVHQITSKTLIVSYRIQCSCHTSFYVWRELERKKVEWTRPGTIYSKGETSKDIVWPSLGFKDS